MTRGNEDHAGLVPCYPPENLSDGVPIQLPRDEDDFAAAQIEAKANDWQNSCDEMEDGTCLPLYHHDGTHAVFRISWRPDAKDHFDTVATFLYVCDGHPMIAPDEITRLGYEALIHDYMQLKEEKGPYARSS